MDEMKLYRKIWVEKVGMFAKIKRFTDKNKIQTLNHFCLPFSQLALREFLSPTFNKIFVVTSKSKLPQLNLF